MAQIVESFEGKPYRVIVPVKFQLARVPGVRILANVHVTDWLPALHANKMADLTVIHGGIGTVMVAALAGRPMVGIGMRMKRAANLACLERLGFAIRIGKSRDPSAAVQAAIDTLLRGASAKAKASQFAQRIAHWADPNWRPRRSCSGTAASPVWRPNAPQTYRVEPRMPNEALMTYSPINTLKRVVDNVWIVDGPVIRFGLPWPKFPFPTRMTVIRLNTGDLFVHSPTPLTPTLREEVEGIGKVRFLISPNRIHYWWITEWMAAYAGAEAYLAPRIKEQAKGRISFEGLPLEKEHGYPWDGEIATLPIAGSFMTEVEFFHRASRTLILTDLIENFEPDKVSRLSLRLLVWIGGVAPPYGGLARDMRLTYTWRHKSELRAALRAMLAWEPERVIFSHGRWYENNGTHALRQAFRWALED